MYYIIVVLSTIFINFKKTKNENSKNQENQKVKIRYLLYSCRLCTFNSTNLRIYCLNESSQINFKNFKKN